MISALYLVLAAGMFYFTTETIEAAGIGFMYRYLLGICIVGLGMLSFLIRPRIKRFVLLMKYSAVLALPYLLILLFSLWVWIFRLESFRFMLRGSFYIGYEIIGVCTAASTIYLFGKKGIWYCFAAVMAAYSIHIAQVILAEGAVSFFSQMLTLVKSFGSITGSMMRELESHDFVFGLWILLLYLLLAGRTAERSAGWILLTIAAAFFALVGLKRIAVLGVAAALLIYTILSCLPETAARRAGKFVGYSIIAAAFVYIVAVHMGLFDYLEEVWSIETKGRNQIYEYLNTQYEISPFYIGKGVAFDTKPWDSSAMRGLTINQNAYHNDFLRMYIELGFAGFFVWAWLCFVFQPGYFFKRQGKQGGLFYLSYCIYNALLYTTDNTVYYYYGNLIIFILAMSYHVEELEKEELPEYEDVLDDLEECNKEKSIVQDNSQGRKMDPVASRAPTIQPETVNDRGDGG